MLGGKKIKHTLDDSLNVKIVGNLNTWSPIPNPFWFKPRQKCDFVLSETWFWPIKRKPNKV
jgi:hypothetical protein